MKNNNLEKIYSKLPKDKTELAKIELAIADDIKSLISQVKAKSADLKKAEKIGLDYRKRVDQLFKEGDKIENSLKKQQQSGDKLVDKAIKLQDKAEKAAKDLGVAPSNIGGYSELDKLWGNLEIDAGAIEDAIKNLYA